MQRHFRPLMVLLAVVLCACVAGFVVWPWLFSDDPAEATPTSDSDESDAVPDPPRREARDSRSLRVLADHQREAEDWTGLGQTLEQICQIDPHDVGIWKYLAWNLGFNVAQERENVDDRYQCVRQAIEALILGVAKNSKNPSIFWETGHFLVMTLGKTPDSTHFRRSFARDLPLHKLLAEHVNMDAVNGPTGQPDSWLVARLWYLESEKIARQHGVPPDWIQSEVLRLNAAPDCLLRYAMATQAEGCSEELAEMNWRRAEREWRQFGRREIKNSRGATVRISDDAASCELVIFEEKLQQCQLEQTQEVLTARTHLLRAQNASKKEQTQRLYEIAWTSWASAVNRHDALLDNSGIVHELGWAIDHYRDTFLQDAQLPEGFPLANVVERWKENQDAFEAALKQLYPDLKLD